MPLVVGRVKLFPRPFKSSVNRLTPLGRAKTPTNIIPSRVMSVVLRFGFGLKQLKPSSVCSVLFFIGLRRVSGSVRYVRSRPSTRPTSSPRFLKVFPRHQKLIITGPKYEPHLAACIFSYLFFSITSKIGLYKDL